MVLSVALGPNRAVPSVPSHPVPTPFLQPLTDAAGVGGHLLALATVLLLLLGAAADEIPVTGHQVIEGARGALGTSIRLGPAASGSARSATVEPHPSSSSGQRGTGCCHIPPSRLSQVAGIGITGTQQVQAHRAAPSSMSRSVMQRTTPLRHLYGTQGTRKSGVNPSYTLDPLTCHRALIRCCPPPHGCARERTPLGRPQGLQAAPRGCAGSPSWQ
jgi:hypothetical protein